MIARAPSVAPRSLLVVDDEKEIVAALRRQFRRDYDVLVAYSAEEGYAQMREREVQVILSDQCMPGMSGSEFFAKVEGEFPDAVRLMLTGYADIGAVIAAINEGRVFRYITKPWNPAELAAIVASAFERYERVRADRALAGELRALVASLEARLEEGSAALAASSERVRELERAQDELLGVVAHDVRDAIGLVLDHVRRLSAMPDPPAETLRTTLGRVERTSSLVLEAIDGRLDDASVRGGRLALRRRRVPVAEVLGEVVQRHAQRGRPRSIDVVWDGSRCPTEWTMDPDRVRQLLEHLIGDAIEVSPPGSTVRVEVARDGHDLSITVSDQGRGVAAEGLGPSICKSLVERHGGRIRAEREAGVGTRVVVTLPPAG